MQNERIRQGGLADLSELDDYQQVPAEFLSPTFKPKVTFNLDSVTFNAACVRLFPDTQYVKFLIHPFRKRVVILEADQYTKDGLKFAVHKNGKNQSRRCLARVVCGKVFDLMEWHGQDRYKVMCEYQELQGVKLMVFNLSEFERVVEEESVNADGKKKKKRRIYLPPNWENLFGDPYKGQAEKYKVDLSEQYIMVDNQTGEQRQAEIKPTIPTNKSLVYERYENPNKTTDEGGSG